MNSAHSLTLVAAFWIINLQTSGFTQRIDGGTLAPGAAGPGHEINMREDVRLVGPMEKEVIRRVIRENRQKIRHCYEHELQRRPTLSGRVAVTFTISAEGTVSASQVTNSTVDDAQVESCLVSLMGGLTFPKPNGGTMVVVTYPFVFNPPER